MAKIVVVTGGAGFIGANLCRSLSRSPEVGRIVVLDDLSTGSADNLAGVPGVDLVVGSVLDRDLLSSTLDGATSIVHLAARPSVPRSLEDPAGTHEANATGTLRVLEAARSAGGLHVVVASSSSVYGANRVLPASEDGVALPMSPYAASKLAAESYALAYSRSFGLPVLVFRFFNVFGPLQRADHAYAAVVPTFVSAALRGDPLPIHGDGNQTRDFTFVGSVVSLLEKAVERRVTAEGPVNLAFGSRHSIMELVSTLETLLGRHLERNHGPARTGDVRNSQADTTRLQGLFPGSQPVPLTEGLAATLDWFRTLDSTNVPGTPEGHAFDRTYGGVR